jgi:hypothetical protein
VAGPYRLAASAQSESFIIANLPHCVHAGTASSNPAYVRSPSLTPDLRAGDLT